MELAPRVSISLLTSWPVFTLDNSFENEILPLSRPYQNWNLGSGARRNKTRK